jgi:hypothetical protein
MKKNKMLGLICGLLLVAPSFSSAQALNRDAREVANSIARTSVRTIYKNLRKEGISWRKIRDRHLPNMLTRALSSIQRGYSSEEILNDFIPTLLRSYYDEIDKINAENSMSCLEAQFISITVVPFIQACETQLGPWRITVTQIVDVVLNDISYPYHICDSSCRSVVKDTFSSSFNYDFPISRFNKICAY